MVVEGSYETSFVEHAYIEPEAGWAEVVDGRLQVQACTQATGMDRETLAQILGMDRKDIRILPTSVGGGFGSKIDVSVQPFLALAALKTGRPVRMCYSRVESMQSTTKRHPARIDIRDRCEGRRHAVGPRFQGRFQHRLLCKLGADRGQPRSGPCLGPLFHPLIIARKAAPSIHIARPRARSAALACRNRPSRRRRHSTCWRTSLASTRWNFASRMRCATGSPRSAVRSSIRASASMPASKHCSPPMRGRSATARASMPGMTA